jgi:hypothetical protein
LDNENTSFTEREEKMKNKKWLIIGAIAAVVVAAIIVTICLLAGGKKETVEGPVNPYEEMGEVVRIEYKYNSDKKELIKKKGKWTWSDAEELSVDQDAITHLLKEINEYTVIDFFEDVENLKEYGLDEPEYSIVFENKKGKTKTIYVGNATGDDGAYWYMKLKNNDTVYVVGFELVNSIDSFEIQRSQSEQMYEMGETFSEE